MSSVSPSIAPRPQQFARDIQRLQVLYSEAQAQLSSGRPSDIALALGSGVGRFVSLENRVESLDTLISSNSIVKARLEVVESAIASVQESSDAFSRNMIASAGGILERGRLADVAKSFAADIQSFAQTSYGGAFVLSGVSTDAPALRQFDNGSSAGRILVADSFRIAFGFDVDDERASGLSAAQIEQWVVGSFSELFTDENWQQAWTDADGKASKVRIGENENVLLPAVSSESALRKIVMASVLMLEFSDSALHDDALNSVVQKSLQFAQGGSDDLTSLRAGNGELINRVDEASRLAAIQKDLYAATAADLVNVDSLELALRIEDLRVRLEASYMATARFNEMSLVNYI